MLNLLSSLVDAVSCIIHFVTHTITSIIAFVRLIPYFVSFAITSLNILPSVIIPFAIASVSVTAYLFIIGRH